MPAGGAQIYGCVEEPRARAVAPERITPDGRFLISGWAFALEGQPVRVRAVQAGRVLAEAPAIGFRDDVADGHPGNLAAGRSGFGFLVEAPAQGGPFELRIEAECDGRPQLLESLTLDVARTRPGPAPSWSPPRLPRGTSAAPRRLLFATHNLNFEGAPIVLHEIATGLAGDSRFAGFDFQVLSPADGPLRERWSRAGHGVSIDPGIMHPPTVDDHLTRVRRLAAFQAARPPEVVVANTLDAFWAVDLAREIDRPAVWIVHESVDPELYFHERFAPDVADRALRALAHARVVFVSHATARLFEQCLNAPPVVIPNGYATPPLGDRDDRRVRARKRLGLPLDRPILLCVGTTCQRKGQRLLVEAMRQLGDCEPYPALILVGARDGAYRRALEASIEELRLGRDIAVIDETFDTEPYYAAADVALCPSFQESLPRVVQEAMALALPVVASAVHGIPELVRHEREGLLFEPGSTTALADCIRRLLADPEHARALGRAGHARIREHYAVEGWIEAHAALLADVAPAIATAVASQAPEGA